MGVMLGIEKDTEMEPIQNDTTMAKIIAFYLPQYHTIAENDRWWGKGFTDWTNVKRATPLFAGHRQPRVPLDGNYYDLNNPSVQEWQASIALEHGVSGFCHYHYWFDGIQLLNRPTDILLARPDIRIGFCLAWANGSWSRTWDGDEGQRQLLIQQTYLRDPARWHRHCDYLLRAWTDDRAIKVHGKPLFVIYGPTQIPHLEEMVDLWRQRAEEVGLPGLYILGMHPMGKQNNSLRSLDGFIEFQPGIAMFAPNPGDNLLTWKRLSQLRLLLPAHIVKYLKFFQRKLPEAPTFFDYDHLWNRIIDRVTHFPENGHACAFVDWDNTPRYGRRARIVQGASPEKFGEHMAQLLTVLARRSNEQPLVFVNAWNEWAEGAYLEPDNVWGYEMLRAVKQAQLQAFKNVTPYDPIG